MDHRPIDCRFLLLSYPSFCIIFATGTNCSLRGGALRPKNAFDAALDSAFDTAFDAEFDAAFDAAFDAVFDAAIDAEDVCGAFIEDAARTLTIVASSHLSSEGLAS